MKINNRYLPFEVYVDINRRFFAEIDWFLYKHFGKKRTAPCGHSKKSKHVCCSQPIKVERVLFSDDKKACYCKVCGFLRIMSNHPLDLEHTWSE